MPDFRHVYDHLWASTDGQRPGYRHRLWLRVVDLLAAWPADSPAIPFVERRLWRADSGKLRESIIVRLSDPTGALDRHSRMTEVKELVRPLRQSLPLRLSSDELLASLDSTRFRTIAELSPPLDLDVSADLLGETFGDLVSGLEESEGPVALSLLASAADHDAGVQLDDPDESKSTVNFRLRLATTDPLPLALMARACAMCSFSGRAEWWVARADHELELAERALRDHGPITPGNSHSNFWMAAQLLSISAPHRTLLPADSVDGAEPERTSQHLLDHEIDAMYALWNPDADL